MASSVPFPYFSIIIFAEVTQTNRSTALNLPSTNSHNSHGSSSTHFPTPPHVGVVLSSFLVSLSFCFFHPLAADIHSSTRARFAALFCARVQRLFLPSGYLPRWQMPLPIIVIDCIPTSKSMSMTVLHFQSLPICNTYISFLHWNWGIVLDSTKFTFILFPMFFTLWSGSPPCPYWQNHFLSHSLQIY